MAGFVENNTQKLISPSCVVEVKKFLTAPEKLQVRRVTTRLPQAMVNGKTEAYIPQMVSLGPYHHRTLKDVCVASYHHRKFDISLMEMYKLKCARDVAEDRSKLIESLHKNISEQTMIVEFEKFYDWKIEQDERMILDEEGGDESQNFGWMMMVDALFLLHLLKKGFNDQSDNHPPAMASIQCDVVKMENQIPLFLLKQVYESLKMNKLEDDVYRRISTDLCSCFQVSQEYKIEQYALADEPHLLGCMHKYVSSFLQIESAEQLASSASWCKKIKIAIDNMVAAVLSIFCPHPARNESGSGDFIDKYNATELVKAGIEFKPFPKRSGKIRFDKYSDTLFLPQIIISDTYTEVMLRNLLALEFNDASGKKYVTHYVELMDCLIDTPEDVLLLRNRGIIVRKSMMITDDYVYKMWDGMYKSFFAGMLELHGVLKSQIKEVLIKNYYKSKIRTMCTEFHQQYLSKPWQVIALFVGIFVLLLDTTQTVCVFTDCQPKSRQAVGNTSSTHFPNFG